MEDRVAIIGGTGKMGQWFAKFFLKKGFKVVISGRTPEKTAKIAGSLGVEAAHSNKEAVKNANLVVVSTPIQTTPKIITEVAHHMLKGSTLFDIASVKRGVIKPLKEAQKQGIRTVSVHPLFGPGAKNINNRNIILIPVSDDVKALKEISTLFTEDGASIIIVKDAEIHDRVTAYSLALPHFINILFGCLVSGSNLELSRYGGTTLALQLMLTHSVFSEDPILYSAIQMENTHFTVLLKNFIEKAHKMIKIIENENVEDFTKVFQEAKNILSKDPMFKDVYEKFYKALEAIDAFDIEN